MLVYCVNIFSIEILGWFYRKNVTPSGDFTDFKDFLNLQEEKEYDLNLPSASSIKDICKHLEEIDIIYAEGGWTIYIPPCKKLRKLIPGISILQETAGLKILKHIGPASETSYTPDQPEKSPGGSTSRKKNA